MKKEENYYDVPSSFEPSVGTKRYWRKTRKVKRQYGNIRFPGLFNTSSYNTDKWMFIFIMSLELAGLYLLGSAVMWKSIIFIGFSVAIFLDVVCVFWSHAKSGDICENLNNQIISKYSRNEKEFANYRFKNFLIKLTTKYPAHLVIFFIAIGKIYFYVEAKGGFDQIVDPNTGAIDLKIFGVLAIYLLIFVLHVIYSGYAIHGYLFKRKIQKEYNDFRAAEHSHAVNNLNRNERFSENQVNAYRVASFSKQLLSANNVSRFNEIPQQEREHYFLDNTDGSYSLYTWSVLKDDDLYSMAHLAQDIDSSRHLLGVYGLKHQLDLMVSNPKFIQNN